MNKLFMKRTQKSFHMAILFPLLAGLFACVGSHKSSTPKPGTGTQSRAATEAAHVDAREQAIKAAVEKALTEPPPQGYRPLPPDTRLIALSVTRQDGKEIVRLNLSKELLSQGTGAELEDALHQILVRLENRNSQGVQEMEFQVLVEGKPLEQYRKP